MEETQNIRAYQWAILACIIVFIPALSVDVMNIDAAQYASISRQMLSSKNWLEIYCDGKNYLDKPPLLFWLSAASFKIFGVSNFAYKLPSFLFAVLGIFSTIRLGELLYDKRTGVIAGLMVTFSFGMFVMTNDIRTDTILLGTTTFSTWQLLRYLKTKSRISFVAGFIFVGLAMLAKGPLGFMLPAATLSSEFAYKRQWKNFVRPEWLLGLLIVAVVLFPMCYGLYMQFDLHPEKMVNDHSGVSGLKFYFWTQSFGRLTGASDWGTKFDNGAGPFFFTHTFMWVFFPWSLIFVGGLFKNLLVLIKTKFRAGYLHEAATTGGFIIVFLALSASRYKLPHYVYVLVPLAAIVSSRFLLSDIFHEQKKMLFRTYLIFNVIFFVALSACTLFLLFVVFPGAPFYIILAVIFLLFAGIIFAFKATTIEKRFLLPLLFALLAFYFNGNTRFYPELLKYESGTNAGRYLAEEQIDPATISYFNKSDHALNFYYGHSVLPVFSFEKEKMDSCINKNGGQYMMADAQGMEELTNNGYKVKVKKEFTEYHVQFLSFNFLFPASRPSTLSKRYLLYISKGQD